MFKKKAVELQQIHDDDIFRLMARLGHRYYWRKRHDLLEGCVIAKPAKKIAGFWKTIGREIALSEHLLVVVVG